MAFHTFQRSPFSHSFHHPMTLATHAKVSTFHHMKGPCTPHLFYSKACPLMKIDFPNDVPHFH